MPSVNFEIPLLFNASDENQLVFTADEFKESFLWGIPLENPITHAKVTDEMIVSKIRAAQQMLERYLDIKLFKQLVTETQDFNREEYSNWGYIKTDYFVNECISLVGRLNEQNQITYPKEWLTVKKSNKEMYFPQVYIVPNGKNNATMAYLSIQYSQFFSFYGARLIPNYWNITYCTGFNHIPDELINILGKIAAINVLPIIEMGIGAQGGMFGLASQSLSLDGLSQSVSKANGGNIFSQRLKQYAEELKVELPAMQINYSGIKFASM